MMGNRGPREKGRLRLSQLLSLLVYSTQTPVEATLCEALWTQSCLAPSPVFEEPVIPWEDRQGSA